MQKKPVIGVATCMKNEGPFILEWVAHFRELGFDEILVMSNDCEDGSDHMLDRLHELGEITHIDNTPFDDLTPLPRGILRAFAHPKIKACDWLLLCDADEMPNIEYGDGLIHDLIEAMPGHTDCIALHWRAFGNSGLKKFPFGENLLDVNKMAEAIPDPQGFHKCIFRPNKFAAATDHMPKEPYGRAIVRNSVGEEMNPMSLAHKFAKFKRVPDDQHTFKGAYMAHFAIRADDVFLLKNHRKDGRFKKQTKYYLNSNFYKRFNKNDVKDESFRPYEARVKARKAGYLKDTKLRKLHEGSVAFFVDLGKTVLTPAQVAEWSK